MKAQDHEVELAFSKLVRDVRACQQCARMADSTRVIGRASGSLYASILVIGEAPGRLGANESAIPFHGDKAGENFESLLEQVGIGREDCFITNAALCNPKDEKGNNATPKREELSNCSSFLRRQIDLVDPKIVVTLGAQALAALKLIEDHDIQLASAVRKQWNWYGRILLPLYHPGQRAMIHRSFFNQLADYRFLAEVFAREVGGKRRSKPSGGPPSSEVVRIANYLLMNRPLSYFSLHKLFYLAEYEFYRRSGRRMTGAYIVRQKDGPYVFELHLKKLRRALPELRIATVQSKTMLDLRPSTLFSETVPLTSLEKEVLDFVLLKYGRAADGELKRFVYLTAPMRSILRKEKDRKNMFNSSVDFAVAPLAK